MDRKKGFDNTQKGGDKRNQSPYSKEDNSGKPKRKRQRLGTIKATEVQKRSDDGLIRLNKYLAHSGVCSRREADKFIQAGVVMVNGAVVTELGTKVSHTDKVQFEGQTLRREKLVYVLLNKPKGFITSMEDPFDRKTVMALVENAVKERIYPVGRLDRNTTGLLLFTNDGQMAKKLTHPSHRIKKIYHVTLNQPLSKTHFEQIQEGIELEDGVIKPDAIAYIYEDNKKEIGLEIHSGKNRIVRRIFEHFDYVVTKLDRVKFGGLTKKDLPRGKWRFLSPAEINMLKILS
jgi:23S rRNA pseudouridine2605 synthase